MKAQKMAEIFDEINEEIKQEKLAKFWKENGTFIIVSVVCVILAVGAKSWWIKHKYEQNTSRTAALVKILEQEDPAELSALAEETKGGHKILAELLSAGLLQEGAKTSEGTTKAIKGYEKIAQASSFPSYYRDLAAILAIGLKAEQEGTNLNALITELAPLTKDGATYQASALELKASLLGAQGKFTDAVSTLDVLLSLETRVPASLKARAEMLKEFYSLQVISDAKTQNEG